MHLLYTGLFGICFLLVTIVCDAGQDFYELLQVSREASSREIRKSFKRLALEFHPDKNPNNPDANEKFVRLNRAYEVLKDEELRKKYDLHGEDGLDDSQSRGGPQYHSWSFFNNFFGIYDDDPEITTFSHSDFEQLVHRSDDYWFVNYYSPQCHHCHDLAPTWRQVAKELQGAIGVGAVNCMDEWTTCRNQGIHSYPKMVLYPFGLVYKGDRSVDDLVRFVMNNVRLTNLLWSFEGHGFLMLLHSATLWTRQPDSHSVFVVALCNGIGADCMEERSAQRLALMLDGIATVVVADCLSESVICSSLDLADGRSELRIYVKPDLASVEETEAGLHYTVITDLDADDVYRKVIAKLPSIPPATPEELLHSENLLLVAYFQSSELSSELKKAALLTQARGIKTKLVNCSEMASFCENLGVQKFSVVLLKPENLVEFFHGSSDAKDLLKFAAEASKSRVTSLSPADFPERILYSDQPWIVDFFAPWCPPCMRFLPEYRIASTQFNLVNFGTVDCTIHHKLCQEYNVRSYPTTVFYNSSSVPHVFHGSFDRDSIVEFISEVLRPSYVRLSPDMFDADVLNYDGPAAGWLIDFFSPSCVPCQQLAPEWRLVARTLASESAEKPKAQVLVGSVNCQSFRAFCREHGVHSYPTIRFYPTSTKQWYDYNEWFRNSDSILRWTRQFLPTSAIAMSVEQLGDLLSAFLSVPSDGLVVVDFYAPWCGHCQVFEPHFEKAASHFEDRRNAGQLGSVNVQLVKVDCQHFNWDCTQIGINAYPTVRLYKTLKNDVRSTVDLADNFEEIEIYLSRPLIDHLNREIETLSKPYLPRDEF